MDHGPGWVGPQHTIPEPPRPHSGQPRSDWPPPEGSSLLTPVAPGCRPPDRLLLSCHTLLAQDCPEVGAGPHLPLSLCKAGVRRSWSSSFSNHSSSRSLTWAESGRGTDTADLERDGACRGDPCLWGLAHGPLGIWLALERPARGRRLGASAGIPGFRVSEDAFRSRPAQVRAAELYQY